MSWIIQRYDERYAVYRDGKRVSGICNTYEQAKGREVVLRREASKTKRPCMTCKETIFSEGPHHRMCNRCRTASGDHLSWLVS